MPLERRAIDFTPLTEAELAAWKDVPVAIAGDAMNRARCMVSAIKPLKAGTRILGHARTVQTPASDNAAVHVAVALARPGEVLVVDAAGHTEAGVWGGILMTAAKKAGIAGVVIDGATRDASEMIADGFPIYCRAVAPRGAQKTDFGMVDGPVSVGGVSIESGDLVIGDDDGIAVVPYAQLAKTLERIRGVMAKEAELLAGIAAGRTTADLLGVTIPNATA